MGIGRQEEWRGRGAPLSSPNPGRGGSLRARPLSLSPRFIPRSSVPSPPRQGHVLGDSPPSPVSLNAGNPLIPVPHHNPHSQADQCSFRPGSTPVLEISGAYEVRGLTLTICLLSPGTVPQIGLLSSSLFPSRSTGQGYPIPGVAESSG